MPFHVVPFVVQFEKNSSETIFFFSGSVCYFLPINAKFENFPRQSSSFLRQLTMVRARVIMMNAFIVKNYHKPCGLDNVFVHRCSSFSFWTTSDASSEIADRIHGKLGETFVQC